MMIVPIQENFKLYSTPIWNQIISAWLCLFFMVWIFAHEPSILVPFIILELFILYFSLQRLHANIFDLESLPVWSLFAIMIAILIVILSLLEKKSEIANPDERPTTDSFFSILSYRMKLVRENKFFIPVIIFWICGIIWLYYYIQKQSIPNLSLFFGPPRGGFGLPGWLFMAGVWWILFLLMNSSPDASWNQTQVFIQLVIAMGFIGVWSVKMIPDGTRKVAPETMKPMVLGTTIFILLFSFIWFSYNGVFNFINNITKKPNNLK